MNPFHRLHRPAFTRCAFTLIETAVAVAMLGLFITMLITMNSNVLGLLRTSKDNVSASQALQERVEAMRIANWVQITSADYIASTLLASRADSTVGFAGTVESITVAAYPATAGITPVQVQRANNAVRIISSSASLKDARMVRVDVQLTWQGYPRNRLRSRATTVLVAKGGITK